MFGVCGTFLGIVGSSIVLSGRGPLLVGIGVGFLLLGVLCGAVTLASVGTNPARAKIDEAAFGAPKIRLLPRQRCPFCHDGVGGATHACVGCGAVYHAECLAEARGCSTLGCLHAAPRGRRRA